MGIVNVTLAEYVQEILKSMKGNHRNKNDFKPKSVMNSNENEISFITEKIKDRPLNKKKLVRRTFLSVLSAVIFALVACVAFLLLEPIFNNWLNPEEAPAVVSFPEVSEETLPQDLLTEEEVAQQEAAADANVQPVEIVKNVTLEISDYKALYTKMYQVYNDFTKSLVTVSGVSSDVDWFSNTYVNEGQTSGLIVANNGRELLILVNAKVIQEADTIQVEFIDGSMADATIKKSDPNTGMTVISVDLSTVGQGLLDAVTIAELGNSSYASILGSPVMAVGRPLGYSDSLVYGMITSMKNITRKTDHNYQYMTTDIQGNANSNGYIINLDGQVIGVIDTDDMSADVGDVLTAYSISDLKSTIEDLSNGANMAYLGVLGTDVTTEANLDLGVPFGAYVQDVEMSTPAMTAGIQKGDVIVKIDTSEVASFEDLTKALSNCAVGATVEVTIQRPSGDEYRSMKFNVVLSQLY